MGGRSLTPQLFALFADLLEKSCGVHYARRDLDLFAKKLEAHTFDLGHASLLDYYYRLRYDDPSGIELHKLVESMLVCETYFFREFAPLVQLVDGHLAEMVRARGHARVWSAACSTGEEPVTLAMLLDDRGLLDKVEIVASDISKNAIAFAKLGQYGSRSVRDGHPPELAERYLDTIASGFAVPSRIRDSVKYETINLLDDGAVRGLGRFDVIVCRNVLIYFHEDQIMRIVDRLTHSLEPAGMLAVGMSESLLRFGSALVCEERGGSFFYRCTR